MNNAIKHIVLLTPGFPHDELDTSCIPALQNFVLALHRQQNVYTITVVSLHYPTQARNYLWNGINVRSLGAANCKQPKRLLYWKNLLKELGRIHRDHPIDILHSFWWSEVAFLGERFAKNKNIRHTCTLMGQEVLKANRYHKKIRILAERLVAISEFQNNHLFANYGIRAAQTIPWGVSKLEKEILDDETQFDILNIGSFNNVKNQEEAIYILDKVLSKAPNLKCLFIGSGTKLTNLQTLVKSLGIEKNIHFAGQLDRAHVLGYLRKSKLMLHTSSYESFGMVFVEAIATRTMIVSRNVGIANPSPWWKLYRDQEDAVSAILSLLREESYPSSEDLDDYLLENTILKYLQFWE